MRLAVTGRQVICKNLQAAYLQMAQEEAREAQALEWAEGTVRDVADEVRVNFQGS